MEKITAESWINAFGITMLLNGAAAAITGIIYLILGIFVPSASLGTAGKIATIVIAVLALIAAPLLYFWGKALWERRPWSRILVIVASWLGIAFSLLLLFGSVMLMLNAAPESRLMGIVLLLVALFVAAYCIFILWLFTRPVLAKIFGKVQAFAWNEAAKVAVVRAWSLIMWVNAVTIGVAGVMLILASPFLARLLAGMVPEFGFWMIIGIAVLIGILLLGIAAAAHFVAKGLWAFQEWARIVMVILAYLSVAFAVANFAMALVSYTDVMTVADALSNLLYAGGLAAVGIWFLQVSARDIFMTGKAKARPIRGKRR